MKKDFIKSKVSPDDLNKKVWVYDGFELRAAILHFVIPRVVVTDTEVPADQETKSLSLMGHVAFEDNQGPGQWRWVLFDYIFDSEEEAKLSLALQGKVL